MEGEGECGQGWGGRQHGNAGGVSVADGEGERAGGELVDGDGLAEVVDAVAGEEAEVGDLGAVEAGGDWAVGGEVADGVVAGRRDGVEDEAADGQTVADIFGDEEVLAVGLVLDGGAAARRLAVGGGEDAFGEGGGDAMDGLVV